MSRGGARPGAGRKPKIETLKARERQVEKREEALRAAREIETATAIKTGQKTATTLMRDAAHDMLAIAETFRPRVENGKAVGDPVKFKTFMAEAANIAGKLAPFEGPTYSSIRITPTNLDLSKLSDADLAKLRELHAKAADDDGDRRGDRPSIN